MKVYAEYFAESGLEFRCNTILQFGASWDLIGSVVLANPGSAEPFSNIDFDSSKKIRNFYGKYRVGSKFLKENWKEFSPDQTMRFVEKIFNGGYINKSKELNGVIQLFNTFNIKNQYLKEAIDCVKVNSSLLFSFDVANSFNEKPVYFGFSGEVLNSEILRPVAEKIFSESSLAVKEIYHPEFSKNEFYHPMYVNRAFKQDHFKKYKDCVLVPFFEIF